MFTNSAFACHVTPPVIIIMQDDERSQHVIVHLPPIMIPDPLKAAGAKRAALRPAEREFGILPRPEWHFEKKGKNLVSEGNISASHHR